MRPPYRGSAWRYTTLGAATNVAARRTGTPAHREPAHGVPVTDASQFDGALAEAFAYVGPAMVEVMTDPALI